MTTAGTPFQNSVEETEDLSEPSDPFGPESRASRFSGVLFAISILFDRSSSGKYVNISTAMQAFDEFLQTKLAVLILFISFGGEQYRTTGTAITLPRAKRETLHTIRIYGTAAGLDVVLRTGSDPDTASPLRVSVIAPGPIGIEDLAVFPNTVEGRTGADTIAGAVLHALELAALGMTPGDAA